MTITLNADEIQTIIAEYFDTKKENVRVGTNEFRKGFDKFEYLPTAAIKDCDMRNLNIVKK